jgi:hypothetical protein
MIRFTTRVKFRRLALPRLKPISHGVITIALAVVAAVLVSPRPVEAAVHTWYAQKPEGVQWAGGSWSVDAGYLAAHGTTHGGTGAHPWDLRRRLLRYVSVQAGRRNEC